MVRAFAFDSGVTITFLSAAAGCSGADFRKEYYVEERLRLLGDDCMSIVDCRHSSHSDSGRCSIPILY